MLDIQPPQFSGSLDEQVIQAELWTRQFLDELDVKMEEIEASVMNRQAVSVEDKNIHEVTVLDNYIEENRWVIEESYEFDYEKYQDEDGWLVQMNSANNRYFGIVLSTIEMLKRVLITYGVMYITEPTESDVLSYISSIAPKQYEGNPHIYLQGNNFWVKGEMYEEPEAED